MIIQSLNNSRLFSNKQVANYIKELGTDRGLSDFTYDLIMEVPNYSLELLDINELLKKDGNLKEYVTAKTLRDVEEDNIDAPIVLDLRGEVLDGYNRILGHVSNNNYKIFGYVPHIKKV